MTPLRWVLLVASAAALIASLLIGEPQVFAPLALCGLVLWVVGAGSAAADAVPFRPLAFACSLATLPVGIALVARGFDILPAMLVAAAAVALQLVPTTVDKLRA